MRLLLHRNRATQQNLAHLKRKEELFDQKTAHSALYLTKNDDVALPVPEASTKKPHQDAAPLAIIQPLLPPHSRLLSSTLAWDDAFLLSERLHCIRKRQERTHQQRQAWYTSPPTLNRITL